MGHSAAESVGVDVEQCEIRQKTELLREVSGNVAVVEIDAGDGTDGGIVQCGRTVNAGVGADIGSDPISGLI